MSAVAACAPKKRKRASHHCASYCATLWSCVSNGATDEARGRMELDRVEEAVIAAVIARRRAAVAAVVLMDDSKTVRGIEVESEEDDDDDDEGQPSLSWWAKEGARMRGSTFQENYRLHYVTYQRLLHLLRRDWPDHLSRARPLSFSLEQAVCLTLYHMGTGGCYRNAAHLFGLHKTTAWRAIKRVRDLLYERRREHIQWPTGNEIRRIAEGFKQAGTDGKGFSNVIGAADGSHIPFLPTLEQKKLAANRKVLDPLLSCSLVLLTTTVRDIFQQLFTSSLTRGCAFWI